MYRIIRAAGNVSIVQGYLFPLGYPSTPLTLQCYRRGVLVVKASASPRGFDSRPQQTKVFKTGISGFPLGNHGTYLGIYQDHRNSATTPPHPRVRKIDWFSAG